MPKKSLAYKELKSYYLAQSKEFIIHSDLLNSKYDNGIIGFLGLSPSAYVILYKNNFF